MPYTIVQEICIQCGSCAPFCKNGAIDWVDHQYVIDSERCEMCGTCRQYCPIDNTIVESPKLADRQTQPAANHR